MYKIFCSFSFDQELVAIVSWDNNVDEKFAPVVKTLIKVERTEGSDSRRKRSAEISEVDLTQTKTTFRLAELGWGSRLSLQVRLGDQVGPQTEEVEVFSETVRADYLSPLTDIQVSLLTTYHYFIARPIFGLHLELPI